MNNDCGRVVFDLGASQTITAAYKAAQDDLTSGHLRQNFDDWYSYRSEQIAGTTKQVTAEQVQQFQEFQQLWNNRYDQTVVESQKPKRRRARKPKAKPADDVLLVKPAKRAIAVRGASE